MLTNRRLRTLVLSCFLIALNFFVAGCWDYRAMENHGFVLGIAIDDVTTPEPKGQYDLPHVTQEAGARKYQVTFELPKLATNLEGEAEDNKENHYLFTGEGESILAISSAISAQTYWSLFFEDTQIVVFSQSVAQKGIGDLLDFFVRNPGMRRRVKLFVTPGRAEDILKGKIPAEPVNSMFIANIMRNHNMMPRFASKAELGEVSKAIRNEKAFYLPMIVMENGDVKLAKTALFNKDKRMVGENNEWEIIGGKIINENLQQGVFPVTNPANPDKLAVFELLKATIAVNSHIEGDKLWFTVDAKLIGNLAENTESEQKSLDPAFLAALEQALTDQFTRQVQAAYQSFQQLKVDPIGLGSRIYRQHPEYWEKVKEHWEDEVLPTVPLEINIKVVVRTPGMTS
jgi:Ger(x)C family germination protein